MKSDREPIVRKPYVQVARPRSAGTVVRGLGIVAVTACVFTLSACLPAQPTPWGNDPKLDDCQKGIETTGQKLQAKIFSTLKKCKESYRKAVINGDPINEVALACDEKLAKVLLFPDPLGKSAMAKAKIKLDDLVADAKCTDRNLVALGHLPVAPFTDKWARLILVGRLQTAIREQVQLVGDTVNIFQALLGTGDCPTCAIATNPPCSTHSCKLSASAAMDANLGFPASTLVGAVTLDVCTAANILGDDLGVLSGPARTIASFPAGSTTGDAVGCAKLIAAGGYIARPASTSPVVSTTTCQDHIINSPDSDECPAFLGAGTILCASSQPDSVHGGTTNGAPCAKFDNSAAVSGSSFVLSTVQVTPVGTGLGVVPGIFPDQRGTDGIACTADDTAPAGPSFLLPLTTGTADGIVIDRSNTDALTLATGGALTGTAFSPTSIEADGILAPGKWVGVVPSLHTGYAPPNVVDTLVEVTLECS